MEELTLWLQRGGNIPLRSFFNTRGKSYRELGLRDRLATMSEQEQLEILSTDGLLVKRPPLLIGEDFALVGFDETEWKSHLKP